MAPQTGDGDGVAGGRFTGFTYREVGATHPDEEARTPLPPPGFHLIRVRRRIGSGPEVQERAGQAVLGWHLHRALGLGILGMDIVTDAPGAEPGVRLVVTLGVGRLRLNAPTRVVWTLREPDRTGFAYGTLPGHPECGEEAFLVERLPDGSVWLTVTSVSRAMAWYTRAAGPLTRVGQRFFTARCGRVLRRLANAE